MRGERPWTDLWLIGVLIREEEGEWVVEYAGGIFSTPDIVDFACGFRGYAERPAELKDWAHVLLAGSAFIDFAGIESTDTGAALLDALWDAADTGILNETTRKIVARLASF